jgi:hypothetical protein
VSSHSTHTHYLSKSSLGNMPCAGFLNIRLFRNRPFLPCNCNYGCKVSLQCNTLFLVFSSSGSVCSEFTYNPRLWPRDALHADFLHLSDCFDAQRSTVRVPDIDPKYKIAVLASKQVRRSHSSSYVKSMPTYTYHICTDMTPF